MEKKFFPSNQRGAANYGWLKAKYSFSFASFFKPDQMRFGKLRVLNDDTIAPKSGFGKHRHENMEIITIPLKGSLKHTDSMGNEGVLETGQVQVMSAGTGIEHNEVNPSVMQETNILQLWVLPKEQDIKPHYEQKDIDIKSLKNQLLTIVTPKNKENGKTLGINQQAFLHLGKLDQEKTLEYNLHKDYNGVYMFLMQGRIKVDGQKLEKRDALGIWDTTKVSIESLENAYFLITEVPLN
ncbi:pirin family protein [Haloflavibacter putidus]|uniref:Pirin family protein n=1 Tax=Haloflavibacter putidus TaxID=2576776 RepID=A0A507ZZZ7_9FLAO|nr:pirin family protein [Haloflavibacter putidus]TQD39152.1 pirin family protein [Haloflavibacter putidus]